MMVVRAWKDATVTFETRLGEQAFDGGVGLSGDEKRGRFWHTTPHFPHSMIFN
jgi:hypothetical protein